MGKEQRKYENKLIIQSTDRLLGVGIDDSTYNFPISDLIGFLNANLDFTGGTGNVNIRKIDYGITPISIVDSTNQRNPIIIGTSDVLFFQRTDPTRGLEVAVFTGLPGTYGNGATQLTNNDIIILEKGVISSDIDHNQTTNYVSSEHVSPDGVSLVIEGGVLVVKQVNGHTVESDVPANADFTNTQRPISDDPTLNDSSVSASTVATNTLSTNIQNHINDTSNPHNVLATQISDFDTEVSNNADVTANTSYRNIGHVPLSQVGQPNGVPPLDANGLIPNQYFIEIVQSDWDQEDAQQTSFIQNKPSDVTNLSVHNTDELPEGLTNLYYKDTRVSQNIDVQANSELRGMLDAVGFNTIVERDGVGNFIGAVKLTAYNKDFGTIAGTVTQGDDSRLLTDVDKGLLIGGADTSLHYHSSDRDRSNHTGTQLASTISDFDTEVSNNADVSANTTHRTSDGSDHSFIDQSITTVSTPTFSQIILSNAATLNSHAVRYDQLINMIGSATWQNAVINIQSAPPISPNTGDRYIVGISGSGSWTGQDNNIAEYNGSSWDFYIPNEGWATYVQDDAFNTNYIFNGLSWVEFGSVSNHNSLSGIQGGTTNEYYHLTSAEYSALHPAVSLAGQNYLSISEQQITANPIDLTIHVTGILADGNLSSNVALRSDINTAGDLSNVAYLNQTNIFSGQEVPIQIDGVNLDRYIRFTEGQSIFQGSYINYDGATNTFSLGTHDANDANKSNDIDIIRITRGSSILRVIGFTNADAGYQVGGTTVIDASRDFIGGSCSFSGSINHTSANSVYSVINGSSVAKILKYEKNGSDIAFFGYGDSGNIFSGAGTESFSVRAENNLHLGGGGNNIQITLDGSSVNILDNVDVTGTVIATFDGTNTLGVRFINSDNSNDLYTFGSFNGVAVMNIRNSNLDSNEVSILGDGTGSFSSTVVASNVFKNATQTLSGTTPAMDCLDSVNAQITLTGNTTITLSNLTDGMSGNIRITQDATGGRTLTLSPTPKVINGGAGVITLTGTANSTDIISWWYDGANLNVNYGFNYS